MISKADASVINFLLTARESYNQEDLHDATKTSANYILIDYFDWLEYLSRIDRVSLLEVTDLLEFKKIYRKCRDLINILKERLNSDRLKRILDINTRLYMDKNTEYVESYLKVSNEEIKSNGISLLEYLCLGYELFVEELYSLQTYLIKSYDYNNSTIPLMVVPFSFGLNRLCYGHVNLLEEPDEYGLLCNKTFNIGIIKDDCKRSPIDFGIRSLTYFKTMDKQPYNLPVDWQISDTFETRTSELIQSKMRYVADCYSQYVYTGFTDNEFKDIVFKDDSDLDPTQQRKKIYRNYFIIGFPFLLPNMKLLPKNTENGVLNVIDLEINKTLKNGSEF